MDGWNDMSRLERDITRIAIGVVTVAGIVGGVLGWVAHQLVEHLHDPTPSDHFRR
jgi:nitrate/TMAO reductase-like tetraheme cytochrome c subunit